MKEIKNLNKFKLLTIELIIALSLGFFTSYMYIQDALFFENMNNKFIDIFFHFRGELQPSQDIVIIDIDEKSLSELGQWPWSRDKIATILENLTKAGVGIIGLDMLFAEVDNSSPKKVLEKFGFSHKDAKDNDEILSQTLSQTPTIMGYLFDFENKIKKGDIPNIATIIIEKNAQNRNFIPQAKGIISNIHVLQTASYSSGFFNTIPDRDGIVRRVPLVVSYEDTIFPSLSLEMLRLVYGAQRMVVNYSDIGITHISLDELNIPTDRFGRLSVNYRGKSKLYKYLSAVDIYKNEFKNEDIVSKIALFGTSAAGLLDLRATPFDSVYAGVEIHASAIDNVLNQDFISYPSWIESVDVSVILAILIVMVIFFTFFGAIKTAIFSMVSIGSLICLSYFMFIENGIILNVIYPLVSATILYMILTSLHYLLETKQKELIKDKFSKKVSKAVAESLIKDGDKDIFQAKEREVSVFFSDIRGFTSISEKLNDPKKLIDFLNIYMTPMTDIITNSHGTVDKFIGDAIMAYWNAPVEVKDHADIAVSSALAQIHELKKVNQKLEHMGYPSIDIGIGINTGLAVVGEMGSSGRSDYTIIGDSVNLGSRTEGLCKDYKAQILITEFTKARLKREYNIEFVDEVKVKGKEEAVKIYKVIP